MITIGHPPSGGALKIEENEDNSKDKTQSNKTEENEDPNQKLRGLQYDTCVQSGDPTVDVGQTLNIAPGEGKNPSTS